ncbi:MAG: HAMP domain-containing protein, partial [Pseudomonadota bacterium]
MGVLAEHLKRAGQESLGALKTELSNTGNTQAVYFAANAMEHFLMANILTERFLITNLPAQLSEARTFLALADEELTNMFYAMRGTDARARVDPIRTSFAAFGEALNAVETVILERNEIRSGTLDVVGPAWESKYESMLVETAERQSMLSAEAASAKVVTRNLLISFTVMALALGVFSAWFVGRSLARQIRQLADRMSALAKGDLDQPIAGQDLKTELGDMARALEVFRENA